MDEESFSLHLRAKDLQHYYSDSLMNLKNQQFMPAKYQHVEVLYQFSDYRAYRSQIKYRLIIFGVTFLFLIALIAVPVYFYKIMGAFYKNNIFTHDNVRRMKMLGLLLLVIYLLDFLLDVTDYYYKNSLIETANYSISVHISGVEWLFMGLITLLIAMILKRSVEIKEEQDLTI